MRQLFLETDPDRLPSVGDFVTLDREESHHFLSVLRGAEGRPWCLVDGRGHRLAARATGGAGKLAEFEILEVARDSREDAGPRLCLACAVVKGKHFEWVVEKAVELGAHRLLPLRTDRGVIEPGKGRRARWEVLMRAALKQSGRCLMPSIEDPQDLTAALASCRGQRLIYGAAPDEIPSAGPVPDVGEALPGADLALFIGPEGGWSPAELSSLVEAGAERLDLGPFTLRTETAAVVGLGILHRLAAGR